VLDHIQATPRSRVSVFGGHLKTAVLALCTFAIVIFAAFAWWDIHNRRLPYDLDIETLPVSEAAPADSIQGPPAKEEPLDPQPAEAHRAPPVTLPEPSAAVETALAARRLLIPVEGVAAAALRDSFDEGRGSRQHQAIDILAPRNTPVVAVEDGTVAKLFHSRFGGITLYQFDPSGRYCYYYAHLQGYAPGIGEGDTIERGQTIGFVGTTGNAPADTPHLHFQIYELTPARRWWEGKAINPYPYLAVR
jgi:murein DD-endopeptidase MepM/ murein hydrolase activator NlpD